jgi:hypothetical protein
MAASPGNYGYLLVYLKELPYKPADSRTQAESRASSVPGIMDSPSYT